jgi:hypothetical protein
MRRLSGENEAVARSLRGGRILAVFATIAMYKFDGGPSVCVAAL